MNARDFTKIFVGLTTPLNHEGPNSKPVDAPLFLSRSGIPHKSLVYKNGKPFTAKPMLGYRYNFYYSQIQTFLIRTSATYRDKPVAMRIHYVMALLKISVPLKLTLR